MAGRIHFKLALSIATFQIIILQNVMGSTPTVFPAANFNPEADVRRLKESMEGFDTDEDTIIDIFAHRNIAQRLQIKQKFRIMVGINLVRKLEWHLGRDFKDVMAALMTPLPKLYARLIYNFKISGEFSFVACLLEVLITWSHSEIEAFAASWKSMTQRQLIDDLVPSTPSDFMKLLISLLEGGKRDTDQISDLEKTTATFQAQQLIDPEKAVLSEKESLLTHMLATKSYSRLRLIFREYKRISGVSIEDAIERDFKGQLKDAYLAVVSLIRNPAIYFAEQLNKAMEGLGTDEETLIRIIVARSEVDLRDIKIEYEKKYGNSLAADIEGDCSGGFKNLLIALLG